MHARKHAAQAGAHLEEAPQEGREPMRNGDDLGDDLEALPALDVDQAPGRMAYAGMMRNVTQAVRVQVGIGGL